MSKRFCHLPEHLLEAAAVESSAYGFSLVSPLLLLSMNRSGFEVNMPCYGGIRRVSIIASDVNSQSSGILLKFPAEYSLLQK